MTANHRRKLLGPAKLAGLTLRNRVIKAGAYEGMCPKGHPSQALIEHHRAFARGGVGVTTVAYCAVSPNGRTFENQMYMHKGILPKLKKLTDAVHAEGAAVASQLGHCGYFCKNKKLSIPYPLGPSSHFNEYGAMSGIPFSKMMTKREINATVKEYGKAAELAKSAGFDAIEIHMGHGYLLSQFLSPLSNKRTDEYGGDIQNRLRFPVAALQSVREAVGTDFPIWAKINLSDGVPGGLEIDDAVEVAKRLEAEGIDAIQMSGGFTSRAPLFLLRGGRPLKEMIAVEKNPIQKLALQFMGPWLIKKIPFQEMFFLEDALRVREAVELPLIYLGGITSLANMERAMAEGFDFVAMARALICDPDLVRKIEQGDKHYQTECDQCNKCIAAMDTPLGTRCVKDEPDFLTARK